MKKMKKALAVMLAATMTLSMGMTAFADTVSPSTAKTFEFTKNYTTSEGSDVGEYPAETLKFTVEAATTNPTGDPGITIEDQTVDNNPDKIIVKIPAYSTVGKYNYTVTERAGKTQGVTYSNVSFGVQVVASYNDAHTAIETQVVFTTSDGQSGKIEGITNYYDLGTLEVSKVVTGSLGSRDKEFEVTVTLTSDKPVKSAISYKEKYNDEDYTKLLASAWTGSDEAGYTAVVTVTVKHGEKVDFANLPYGVEWTVKEDDYTSGDANSENGYDAPKYSVNNGTSAEATDGVGETIATNSAEDTVEITNNKGVEVDTGIVLDSAPYILLLALAVLGMFGFVSKKRSMEF